MQHIIFCGTNLHKNELYFSDLEKAESLIISILNSLPYEYAILFHFLKIYFLNLFIVKNYHPNIKFDQRTFCITADKIIGSIIFVMYDIVLF
ncbi:hypothetical protein C1645_129340 [Glomus cerebriforme]|uniref:Uncharacterized protein n=1 Tax=Glomus cerebriforme TaxID=658196 RepID=A0A397TK64_9GLOM|nr:hypothetical protein C1645_129340 [Glomus cerebriforme]